MVGHDTQNAPRLASQAEGTHMSELLTGVRVGIQLIVTYGECISVSKGNGEYWIITDEKGVAYLLKNIKRRILSEQTWTAEQ